LLLATPAAECGCLPGSTRRIVIELAREAGLEVVEGAFDVEHLRGADEAFITSVSREVSSIARIDDRPLGEEPGTVTKTLADAFSARVRKWLDGLADPPA